MAGKARQNFIGILIAIAIFVVGGLVGGWLFGSGMSDGEVCYNPDGCSCGVGATCGPRQVCEKRLGVFGSCRD